MSLKVSEFKNSMVSLKLWNPGTIEFLNIWNFGTFETFTDGVT